MYTMAKNHVRSQFLLRIRRADVDQFENYKWLRSSRLKGETEGGYSCRTGPEPVDTEITS